MVKTTSTELKRTYSSISLIAYYQQQFFLKWDTFVLHVELNGHCNRGMQNQDRCDDFVHFSYELDIVSLTCNGTPQKILFPAVYPLINALEESLEAMDCRKMAVGDEMFHEHIELTFDFSLGQLRTFQQLIDNLVMAKNAEKS